MRVLKFIVKGQSIQKDPSCDFRDIVKGTSGYLTCQFTFDSEWNGYNKVAEFRRGREQNPVPVLIRGGTCEVPAHAANAARWNIRVVGGKGNMRIRTAACEVAQKD